jgi:hypothetical protein
MATSHITEHLKPGLVSVGLAGFFLTNPSFLASASGLTGLVSGRLEKLDLWGRLAILLLLGFLLMDCLLLDSLLLDSVLLDFLCLCFLSAILDVTVSYGRSGQLR